MLSLNSSEDMPSTANSASHPRCAGRSSSRAYVPSRPRLMNARLASCHARRATASSSGDVARNSTANAAAQAPKRRYAIQNSSGRARMLKSVENSATFEIRSEPLIAITSAETSVGPMRAGEGNCQSCGVAL